MYLKGGDGMKYKKPVALSAEEVVFAKCHGLPSGRPCKKRAG